MECGGCSHRQEKTIKIAAISEYYQISHHRWRVLTDKNGDEAGGEALVPHPGHLGALTRRQLGGHHRQRGHVAHRSNNSKINQRRHYHFLSFVILTIFLG